MMKVNYLYSVEVQDIKSREVLLKENFHSLEEAISFFSIVDASLNHENVSISLTH